MSRRATESVVGFHDGVAELCKDRLRDALNPKTALFDRQLRERRWDDTYDTEDLTSTAICLVGLHRAGVDPARVNLDPAKTLSALSDVTRRRKYSGGVGLVIWANALWKGPSYAEVLAQVGESSSEPRAFAARLTTMEVAWLVSGLEHESRRGKSPAVEAALNAATAELLARHSEAAGLFSHASDAAPPAHRVRKSVPNFADQIYGVQAAAFAALAHGNAQALAASEACARRLVELQGPLGQWWWHYDSRNGEVAQPFPVYAVHQHAMAPMALMTLHAAGGTDYSKAVELSHAWVATNESGVELFDRQAGTIWRDVELDEGQVMRALRHARSLSGLRIGSGGASARNLKINFETRPYEWAWCLFAGAIAAGTKQDEHLV
jgi:hypothetical protein